MNIRITAPSDQVAKLSKIFSNLDIENKIYSNRGTTKTKRLYINLDDRESDKYIEMIENINTHKHNATALNE